MPLDLPTSDAGFSFTGVWVAERRPADGGWDYGPAEHGVVDGRSMVLAWSDEDEGAERYPYEHFMLFESSVSHVLCSLPPGRGLVVDPHAERPRVVPVEDRERVMRLGIPWQPDVPYVLHELEDVEVDGFLTDLRAELPEFPHLGRVWCMGYEVIGGPAVPLVLSEEYFVDLSTCTLRAMEAGGGLARIELGLLSDVPAEALGWFEQHPPVNA